MTPISLYHQFKASRKMVNNHLDQIKEIDQKLKEIRNNPAIKLNWHAISVMTQTALDDAWSERRQHIDLLLESNMRIDELNTKKHILIHQIKRVFNFEDPMIVAITRPDSSPGNLYDITLLGKVLINVMAFSFGFFVSYGVGSIMTGQMVLLQIAVCFSVVANIALFCLRRLTKMIRKMEE